MSNPKKPIFTGEFVAFSPFDHAALARLAKRAVTFRGHMLEVGSWLGNGSTQTLLKVLQGGALFCVDTWKGNPNVERHQDIVSRFDVFRTFKHNIDNSNRVHAIQKRSLDAVADFEDGSLDLVFIDGDHSHEAVKEDIQAWLPKVRPGGILCGHDCEVRVTPKTRDHFEASKHLDTIDSPDPRFLMVHPGSILAVHETLGERVQLTSDSPIDVNGASGYSAVWFVEN